MNIILKSFFMNGWHLPAPEPVERKTWLQSQKSHENWVNIESLEQPNFNTEGEETYID